MAHYSKLNMVYRLQKWMDSVPGQTFLNYAYSWGASIVILGTLFKLTHLPGANFMLFLGMGTEVLVFFLSAFDRPFDKTQDGMEIPTHLEDDDFIPTEEREGEEASQTVQVKPLYVPSPYAPAASAQPATTEEQAATQPDDVATQPTATATTATGTAGPSVNEIAAAVIKQQSEVIGSAQGTPEMIEAQSQYVEALQSLTELLGKVSDQSERLTRDSEEMENLNRTLTGITKIYEMQLKGASQQVGTIDQINEQTRKMAQQIEQLNSIYARMIEAMTVNMRVAAPGAAPATNA